MRAVDAPRYVEMHFQATFPLKLRLARRSDDKGIITLTVTNAGRFRIVVWLLRATLNLCAYLMGGDLKSSIRTVIAEAPPDLSAVGQAKAEGGHGV